MGNTGEILRDGIQLRTRVAVLEIGTLLPVV